MSSILQRLEEKNNPLDKGLSETRSLPQPSASVTASTTRFNDGKVTSRLLRKPTTGTLNYDIITQIPKGNARKSNNYDIDY